MPVVATPTISFPLYYKSQIIIPISGGSDFTVVKGYNLCRGILTKLNIANKHLSLYYFENN